MALRKNDMNKTKKFTEKKFIFRKKTVQIYNL